MLSGSTHSLSSRIYLTLPHRDQNFIRILANELVLGDIITFSTSVCVPLADDIRFITAIDLDVDDVKSTLQPKPMHREKQLAVGTSVFEIRRTRNCHDHGRPGEPVDLVYLGLLVRNGRGSSSPPVL